jgi:gamma-glutamylcysteine synthetase
VAGELGLGFLGLGFTPTVAARRGPGDAQGPLRDHARYMPKVGGWAWT